MFIRNDTHTGEYFETLEEMFDYIPIDKNYLERKQTFRLLLIFMNPAVNMTDL